MPAHPATSPALPPAQPTALPPALDAERFEFEGLSCYAAGEGPPLLLVHSVNAAASAAEVRPLFEHARARRRVFALDLPGYGLSLRGAREYTPRLMTQALQAAAVQIRQHCGPGPIDALAVSLSCEFLARAAVERPADWRRLALVSPTGFNGTRPRRGPPGSTRALPWLQAALKAPLWSEALFRGLTRPGVVRYFLQRTWGGKVIDERMWAYAVATAHQPGARHAPLAFLSGALFSADIHTVYEALTQPVWVSHGVRGDFTDYRGLGLVSGRPNWRVSVFDTGALPYFEQPAAFFEQMDALLPP
ncbi:MAG: alpha/beta hydrolase [Burkholderiales bacterium]|nr:alpha/beta hydrolase [Burkholderiales bacterium]MDE2275964.1 alpha/beta hydrolase [Burkholderiales bacterium]